MPDEPKITKAKLQVLERVFDAEIHARLPFQSKAKIMQVLVADDLVEPMKVVLGGRFPITVEGYQLTHRGRVEYCMSCK